MLYQSFSGIATDRDVLVSKNNLKYRYVCMFPKANQHGKWEDKIINMLWLPRGVCWSRYTKTRMKTSPKFHLGRKLFNGRWHCSPPLLLIIIMQNRRWTHTLKVFSNAYDCLFCIFSHECVKDEVTSAKYLLYLLHNTWDFMYIEFNWPIQS